MRAGPVLLALDRLGANLAARRHRLLGPATVHACLITGGQEASTIPDRCVLMIEHRTLPGTTPVSIAGTVDRAHILLATVRHLLGPPSRR